jgi:uncharacterized protein
MLSIAQAALAGPIDDALSARAREDYATALRLLRPLADNEDAVAQVILGDMYGHGQGVPQDYKEAVKWYRSLADQGNSTAQLFLGLMYADGRGVPQDR